VEYNRDKLLRFGRIILKTAAIIFLVLVSGYFFFRGYFLGKVIDKIAAKFKNEYHTEFKVKDAGFDGLAGVKLEGISIVPDGKDTLLRVDHFSASVRFGYALLADIRVKDINLQEGYLQLVKRGEYRNFDNFLHKEKEDNGDSDENDKPTTEINYAKIAYKLISRLFAQVPNEVLIDKFSIRAIDDDRNVQFDIMQFSLKDKIVSSNIDIMSGKSKQTWQISGFANPSAHKADLHFRNADSTAMVMIPYIDERFHFKAGFDNIRLQLNGFYFENEKLKITGYASVKNLLINHAKISKKDVVIENASCDYTYLLGANFISLDSSSEVTFNGVIFHPYIRFENKPDTIYYFSVRTEKTMAQDFINSLPEGLFSHITGMETTGSFIYRLDFVYNENRPQDMIFESAIEKDNLHITKYGQADLGKLNDEFFYTPMENGRPMRAIVVGPDNPHYAALEDISPYLKKSVLTTEDPSFMYHRGFIVEAFKQSIAKNIRTGRFSRGASTISMQLVKNVFLTREKTMSRKLEEILLVYILENNYLCPKERMFEVYLNIIEWGPNVYGIGEASEFYFKKRPAELTLSESLYLATIIPRPKGFMWRFDKQGSMREFATRQFKFLGELMLRRNLLLPEDTSGFMQQVKIIGPAKKFIIKNDSNVVDTLIKPEEDLFE